MDALLGRTGCPHCANPFAFAVCVCGRLMCVSGPGEATYPWCGQSVNYAMSEDGSPGVNLTRGRG
ncbi:MAG TPA: TerY-C metal binding domain-containing protein [Gammaproteobacteria bacterium]|nr:TerY-C metal binding domain-containing protein [Gammaproteobacteria bacterium]